MPIPSNEILPSLDCNAYLSSTPGRQPCFYHLGSGESCLGPAEGGDAVRLKKSVLLLNSKPRHVLLHLVHRMGYHHTAHGWGAVGVRVRTSLRFCDMRDCGGTERLVFFGALLSDIQNVVRVDYCVCIYAIFNREI